MLTADTIPPCRDDAFEGSTLATSHLGAFMFTRTSSPEPKSLAPRTNSNSNAANELLHSASGPDSGDRSVIRNDLKIIGQGLKIVGRGVLQIDGEIESDVQAAEVIVGEQGKVTGIVAGQQVVVSGKVSGIICAKTITLQASSNAEGDVHHMSLAVERGAKFEGRSRRAANESELDAIMEAKDARRESSHPAP